MKTVYYKEFKRIEVDIDLFTNFNCYQDKLDKSFDSFEITSRFAKYAEVIYLWNVKVANNLEHSYFSVLPTLLVEEGWADIERYLKIINKENKCCKILFEHRSDLISDEELEKCYRWINNILTN